MDDTAARRPRRRWVVAGSVAGFAVLAAVAVFPAVDASRGTMASLGALRAGGVHATPATGSGIGSGANGSGSNGSGSNGSGITVSLGGVRTDVPPGVATPAEPDGLPGAIEALAPYVKQSSCDPTDKPGSVALGRLLQTTYPGTSYSIGRGCGADGIASEHYEGRAVDWFTSVRVPDQAARAQALLAWLFAPDAQGRPFANARRLGVMYIIWDDQIWGSYATASGWRPYNGCAARPEPSMDTTCHRDHVHLSLSWAGAMKRTSFWTGTVAADDYGPCRPSDLNWAPPYTSANPQPCPQYATVAAASGTPSAQAALVRYGGATVGVTSTGPVVQAVQRALDVTADGTFGPQTAAAVATFQRTHGQTPTSRMDAATWRALIAAGGAPQASTGGSPSGTSSPGSSSSSGSSSGSSSSGSSSSGTSPSGRSGSAVPRLAYGMRGSAVSTLQRRLGVRPVSGWFGPATWNAVAAVQRAHHLPVTGVVDAATWRLLAP